jgi:peptidoglycan hydrolase-like protein with peptidoglycan-binding domain
MTRIASSLRLDLVPPDERDATAPSTTTTSPPGPPSSGGTSPRTLRRGARGPEVVEAQNLLLRAGYSLQRYGADGRFGGETNAAVLRFQKANGLPQTGSFDAQTLKTLAATPPPKPNYDALFADGVLRGVLAVGYDESGAQQPERTELIQRLEQRGFHPVTRAERAELGLGATGRFVTKFIERHGAPARVLLELVTDEDPDAKQRFAAALRTQELVLYGGHGRYGSGPDFDDIRSPAGNFVIGAPFEPGHVTVGKNDLDATPLTPGYQLMFFDGCNTFRYFDDLRARTGKGNATLDVIGSNDELYWHDTAENLLAALDGFTSEQDLEELGFAFDLINRRGPQNHAFRSDGFEDNTPR